MRLKKRSCWDANIRMEEREMLRLVDGKAYGKKPPAAFPKTWEIEGADFPISSARGRDEA
jgi:hypothetical protein